MRHIGLQAVLTVALLWWRHLLWFYLSWQACAQELEDVRGAARVEAQLAWDAAEASEAQASELVHKVMLDATQGMQRRLTATADATSDAAAAARAVSGAADWGAFCQATRQKAPFLDGAAPAAPLLPNMAQVEKMGRLITCSLSC